MRARPEQVLATHQGTKAASAHGGKRDRRQGAPQAIDWPRMSEGVGVTPEGDWRGRAAVSLGLEDDSREAHT